MHQLAASPLVVKGTHTRSRRPDALGASQAGPRRCPGAPARSCVHTRFLVASRGLCSRPAPWPDKREHVHHPGVGNEEPGVRSPQSWPSSSVSGNKRTLQREALCRAGPSQLTASAGAGPWAQPYLGGGRGLERCFCRQGLSHGTGPAGAGTDRLALSPGVQRQRVGVRAGSEVQKHARRPGPGQGQERALRSLALATVWGRGEHAIHLPFGQSLSSGMLGPRYKPYHNAYHCPAYTDE